jgi:hypothetical protein
MSNWQTVKWAKCQVDKTANLSKCQVDKAASWQNLKLTKCQVDKMSSWQNVKLTKCQFEKNVKFTKWQVDKMSSWQNVMLKNGFAPTFLSRFCVSGSGKHFLPSLIFAGWDCVLTFAPRLATAIAKHASLLWPKLDFRPKKSFIKLNHRSRFKRAAKEKNWRKTGQNFFSSLSFQQKGFSP